ncbi:MAG TPA: ATP-binding protein [Verrucomicrobiae bacterium]|nr:ATP-binding protein [Verrucomicrobiae bacterium]
MKTLLVLGQHPDFAEAVRAAVNPESYRIIHRLSLDEAEPLLHGPLFSACIIDLEPGDARWIWMIEKLRQRAPQCPVIVFGGASSREWEEEAYMMGVAHVLSKPVRSRLLSSLLDRIFNLATPTLSRPTRSLAPASALREMENAPRARALPQNAFQPLEFSRHFSTILTHSLDAEAMLTKFLLLLREMVGVNRAAIFFQESAAAFGKSSRPEGVRRLRKGCAIGLPADLLDNFGLSFEVGIGGQISQSGKILRRDDYEARADAQVQLEFEALGAQVAVPILDRDTLVGVAVFDGRITGEPLVNQELEVIFHLLEELALAVKNIWLHDQLAANHEMMADIFRQLNSACVVVGQDLAILHANKTARGYFGKAGSRGAVLEFSDLPAALGAKVFQVLRTGTAIAPFRYHPEDSPDSIYNVSVVPFQKQGAVLPASALLMAEDLTQSEQLRKLELEAANLRLVTTMADRLAHEIGNALVPLSTHQQLLKERYKDPEFRATLETAMADSVKRVTRLINQMRFLSRDSSASVEDFPMSSLIEDAYQEAQKHQAAKVPRLDYKNGAEPIIMHGDRAALKHAFSEIILNALQANPTDPKIGVRIHAEKNGSDHKDVQIEIQDNGTGFTSEAGEKAQTPFYTTRNVGLGLGLTVSRKIIETHHGKLEIVSPKAGHSGLVRVTLPLTSGNAPEKTV